MTHTEQLALRMPGRVLRELAALAVERHDRGEDLDLCELLSSARIRRAGAGFTAKVPIADVEQARRLVAWIPDTAPAYLREYRDMVRRDGD